MVEDTNTDGKENIQKSIANISAEGKVQNDEKNKRIRKTRKKNSGFPKTKVFAWIADSIHSGDFSITDTLVDIANRLDEPLSYAMMKIPLLKIPWLRLTIGLQKIASLGMISSENNWTEDSIIDTIVLECGLEKDISYFCEIFQEYAKNSQDKKIVRGCHIGMFWLTAHTLCAIPAYKNSFWRILVTKSWDRIQACWPASAFCVSAGIKSLAKPSRLWEKPEFYAWIQQSAWKEIEETWQQFIHGDLGFINMTHKQVMPQGHIWDNTYFPVKSVCGYDTPWTWEKAWYELLAEQAEKFHDNAQREVLERMMRILDAFFFYENPILVLGYFLKHHIS